jgi:hypothetical protein
MAVEVDGQAVPLSQVTVMMGQKAKPATEITPSSTLYFPVGSAMTVKVAGAALPPGEHKVVVRINTWEAGAITIPITAAVV